MTPDTVTQTRRDLLKKLAAASATAGVAATMVSSHALADLGTINSMPINTNLATASLSQVSLTQGVLVVAPTVTAPIAPAIACPFPSTSPPAPKVEYAWQLSQATPVPNNQNSVSITSPTAGVFSTALQDVTITAAGLSGSNTFAATFTLLLTVRWVCPQRPPRQPTVAWRCVTFSATITREQNGTLSGLSPFSATAQSAICNASTPTLP
jgi:hypothetical protein